MIPRGYGYGYGIPVELANEFDRAFELASVTEASRITQDAEPPARLSEDRLANALARIAAGTYTPRGQHAWSLASQGGTTGMAAILTQIS